MNKTVLHLVVAALCLAAPATASAGWSELTGGTLRADPASNAREAAAATLGGVPYLAWSEGSGQSADIRVARLGRDGGWEIVGSPDPTGASSWSIEPALAVVGGDLHVAWAEKDTRFSTNRFQVQVERLEDGAFVPVAPTPNLSTSADGRDPQLADLGGVLHVAWIEGDQQSLDVRAARLVDGAWQRTGSIDHSTRAAEAASSSPLSLIQPVTRLNASDPALSVIDGVLHVAWSEDGFAYVARLDGDSWTEVGGGPANGGGDGATQTTLTGVGGVPFVAWRTANGSFSVRVAALAGSSWADAGAAPSGGSASQPSLLALGGQAWLGWVETAGLRVARLVGSGTVWEPVGDALSAAPASAPALVDAGGIPLAGWHEGHAGRSDVRLARLEPDLLGTEVTPAATAATVVTRLDTFGLSFPVAFDHGAAGSALTERTETSTASGGETSVTAVLTGLRPKTDYEVRPVVGATAGADLLGEPTAFTTTKRNGK